MTLNSIPEDLFYIILSFLEFSNKKNIILNKITENINDFYSINLTNKYCKEYVYSNQLNLIHLKDIDYLIKKYHVFLDDYNVSLDDYHQYKKRYHLNKNRGFPILIDILSSGINHLPLIRKSLNYIDDMTLNDIVLCLTYFPDSVNSNYGGLRCRTFVGPFYFACLNENIPVSILKLLIEKGCCVDETLLVNGDEIKSLEDLNDPSVVNIERYNEIIKTLFE